MAGAHPNARADATRISFLEPAMTAMAEGQAKLIHRFDCDIWDLPDQVSSSSDSAFESALAMYLSSIGPAYTMLTTVIGQIALLLLLATDCSRYRWQIEMREPQGRKGPPARSQCRARWHFSAPGGRSSSLGASQDGKDTPASSGMRRSSLGQP